MVVWRETFPRTRRQTRSPRLAQTQALISSLTTAVLHCAKFNSERVLHLTLLHSLLAAVLYIHQMDLIQFHIKFLFLPLVADGTKHPAESHRTQCG